METFDGIVHYTTGESAKYLGIGTVTLARAVKRYNNAHPDTKIIGKKSVLRTKATYYAEDDLKKLQDYETIEP